MLSGTGNVVSFGSTTCNVVPGQIGTFTFISPAFNCP
jgi:hypothetical protein